MKRRTSSTNKGKTASGASRREQSLGLADRLKSIAVKGRMNMSFKIILVLLFALASVQVYLALILPGLTSSDSEESQLTSFSTPSTRPQRGCVLPNETVNAIARAKTLRCKAEFQHLACAIQDGKIYPKKIMSSCPRSYDVSQAGGRLGCYKDISGDRILKGAIIKDKNNHPEKCVNTCLKYGYEYAGVQYGVECFCGNSLPEENKIKDKLCDTPCPGGAELTCGGYLTMDVYMTGLKPLLPPRHGYETTEADKKNVGVVFLLTLNGRAFHQVLRLIDRLDGPGSYFYIHVDARQSYLYKKLEEVSRNRTNIEMARTRFTTIWGGSSLLTMLLSCIKHLLTLTHWDWQFVLNLSESDYLVKTREELFEFLSANKGSNFVKSHGRTLREFIRKQGLDRTFYQCEDRMWRLGHRELPAGIQWDGGSDWICLNREFSDYVVNSNDTLVTELRSMFNLTLLPAESFFHVALRNSRFCGTYINNNLHQTNWNRKQGCKCQTKAVVDWCGCSPNDFLKEDWLKIQNTRPKQVFFARKFEPIIHNGILNKIDGWLGLKPWPYSDRYWQSVYSRDYDAESPGPEFFMLFNFIASNFIQSINAQLEQKYEFEDLVEVCLLKHNDVLDSIILDIQARSHNSDNNIRMQLRIQVEDELVEDARLTHLSAGTMFDLKELVFRNFIRLITTRPEDAERLRGRVVFAGGKTNETYEMSWLDPQDNLVAVNTVEVEDSSYPVIIELDPWEEEEDLEKVRLTPGVWRVVCTHLANIVHVHRFLVLPDLVNGIKNLVTSDFRAKSRNSETRSLPRSSEQLVVDPAHALENPDLNTWLEQHVPEFYTVTHFCVDDESEAKSCANTSWSSRLISGV